MVDQTITSILTVQITRDVQAKALDGRISFTQPSTGQKPSTAEDSSGDYGRFSVLGGLRSKTRRVI